MFIVIKTRNWAMHLHRLIYSYTTRQSRAVCKTHDMTVTGVTTWADLSTSEHASRRHAEVNVTQLLRRIHLKHVVQLFLGQIIGVEEWRPDLRFNVNTSCFLWHRSTNVSADQLRHSMTLTRFCKRRRAQQTSPCAPLNGAATWWI